MVGQLMENPNNTKAFFLLGKHSMKKIIQCAPIGIIMSISYGHNSCIFNVTLHESRVNVHKLFETTYHQQKL